MVSSNEKDKILTILYNTDLKYDGIQELGYAQTSYTDVLEESGLESYVFSLAFTEISKDGYAGVDFSDETITRKHY